MRKDLKNGRYEVAEAIKTDKCNGCALCAEFCPDIAIEVWRGKKKNPGPLKSGGPTKGTRRG
jgi:NAD-dependent dihydropyrimidine dehydrogenase PreA subunit